MQKTSPEAVQGRSALALAPEPLDSVPVFERAPSIRKRVTIKTVWTGCKLTAVAVGAVCLGYQAIHLTRDEGANVGQQVPLQSPVKGGNEMASSSGSGTEGAPQKTVDGWSRRNQSDTHYTLNLASLKQQVDAKQAELTAARQRAVSLTQQLQTLQSQHALQGVNSAIASEDLQHLHQAIAAAQAQEKAARLEFERYRLLQAEGMISLQQLEELRAVWDAAKTAVEQAETEFETAASLQGLPADPAASDRASQQAHLRQQIHIQVALIDTLATELKDLQQRFDQAQRINHKPREIEISRLQ